jgi:hypothetical protein
MEEGWVSITFNVMEHLTEHDKDSTLVPRLATAWRWLDDRVLEVTLRQLERTEHPHCATSDREKTGIEIVVFGSVLLIAILSMVSKTSGWKYVSPHCWHTSAGTSSKRRIFSPHV